MKNPRFNDRTFRLLFSLLFIVIFGCTEKEILEPEIEEFQVTEQQEVVKVNDRVTTLDHKEIPEVMEGLLSKLGKTGKTILNGKLSYNNVDIDLREIKEVVNKGTNVNYSFAMDVKGRPNHIFNLIVTKMPDGTIKDPKVIGYHMKPKDMEAFFKSGEDYRNFITDYKYYRYESFFADSKFDLVGRSGDCGSGSTGGSTASSSTPPGGTFTHSYGGHTVTNIFSPDAVNIPYGYTSNIRTQNDTQLSTLNTKGWSKEVQISLPGPIGIISYSIPPSTVSMTVTSDAGKSGPGVDCATITQLGDTWLKQEKLPCFGPQQKTASTAMSSGDCTSPDGTFAINTAAKAVSKLDYHLPGGLNSGQFGWFSDSNYPNRKYTAQDLVWFLLDNGKSEDSIIFVILAVEALVKGGSVDVDDRIINFITFPCASQVVDDANQMDNPISKKIKDSFGDQSSPDLFYANTDIEQYNENGAILGRATPKTDNQGNITSVTIELDNEFLESATDLSIFATVIHENMHALMYYQLSNGGINIDDDNIDYSYLADQWSKYVAHVKAGVPQNQNLTDLAIQQHQIMGDLVMESAQIIQNYGNSKGYNVSSNTAEALAWAGLQSSVAWTLLDEIVKENYKMIIDDESSGFEILAIGSPCN